MILRKNIEYLAGTQGLDAVAVYSPSAPREMRGDEIWGPTFDACLSLLEKTGESTIRVVLDKSTIMLDKQGEEVAAVAFRTGHAVAKSLRRMIRRASRRQRSVASLRREPTTSVSASTFT